MPLSDPKYVDVDGIGTRYFEKGEGEPMVLVHGGHMGTFAADLADDWDTNFDALSEHYRVYALDKLGMGFTDNPKTDDGYTIQAQTDHVSRFMETLGIGPAHLCGHSRGGYLVTRLALQHPEQCRSCIIVDSGTLSPGAGRNEIVHADPPLPLRSRECHRWVFERYSYSPACVTEGWLDVAVEAAHTAKYEEAVRKMSDEGLLATKFLPDLPARPGGDPSLAARPGIAALDADALGLQRPDRAAVAGHGADGVPDREGAPDLPPHLQRIRAFLLSRAPGGLQRGGPRLHRELRDPLNPRLIQGGTSDRPLRRGHLERHPRQDHAGGVQPRLQSQLRRHLRRRAPRAPTSSRSTRRG